MALSLLSGGRCNSLWDPLWSESAWQPFEAVHFVPTSSLGQDPRAIASEEVNWAETDDAHVFKADLPGFKEDEIKLELEEDRTLLVSGEHNRDNDRWDRAEISHGQFLRRFKVPHDAQADLISAELENGVLTVTVPKIQPRTPEKNAFEIS